MDQISVYVAGIILAYTAFLLSIMSPGPNVLAIMGTSMSIGRSSGLALALGVASGSFCWAMLTVVGLSTLLASYATAFSTTPMVRLYAKARRWIQGTLGAFFAFAGLKRLSSRG